MRRSTIIVLITMTLTISALCVLGTWQVKRLGWKEELIAMTNARSTAVEKPLSEIEGIWSETGDVDYMVVSLNGQFNHSLEMYYYTTWNGRAGWNVITPLTLTDGRYALINRGFVPLEYRDTGVRESGQLAGVVQIEGLARNPIFDKPNSLMPDNTLEKRELFWKSQDQMISLIGNIGGANILPFMIDAAENELKYPLGGTTRITFPNSHLQYAVTWYGLALSLLVIGSMFLWGRRKQGA